MDHVSGPELLNLSIHIHQDELLSPNKILDVLWELGQVFIRIENYKSNARRVKDEIVWNPLLSLMRVIDSLPTKESGVL